MQHRERRKKVLKKYAIALLLNLLVTLLFIAAANQAQAATYTITNFTLAGVNSPQLPSQTINFQGSIWYSTGSGTFQIPPGLNVEFQTSTTPSGPWTTITTATTIQQNWVNYQGTFTTPSTLGIYYYRSNFPEQPYAGNTISQANSSVIAMQISYPTTTQLNALPTLMGGGQTIFTFSGQITSTPNVPNGAPVILQYYSGGWKNLKTVTTTNNNGQFSGTATAPSSYGTIKFQAYFAQYNTGGIWRTSISDQQNIQIVYGFTSAAITPNEFHSGINQQYTIRVTNLATNPSGRTIGQIQINIPSGFIVNSATVNAQSKVWNTPTIASGIIKTTATTGNSLNPGEYLDITFTPTSSPTSGTTFVWTTNAWLEISYQGTFYPVQGSQPLTTLVYPTIQSTTVAGITKNDFNPDETIHVTGQKFIPEDIVNIYVVIHKETWNINDALNDRTEAVETVTATAGSIATTPVWSNADPGLYDIIVDSNQNGQYDANDAIDNLDVTAGGTGGFFVVPEYAVGALAALATCFIALVAFKTRENPQTKNPL